MTDKLRGRRVTGNVDVYHPAWVKHPWRIWLAIGCLLVGTSFASESNLLFRFVGCVSLIWVPLLIIDHTLSALQQMSDAMYAEIDDRLDELIEMSAARHESMSTSTRVEPDSTTGRHEMTDGEYPTAVMEPVIDDETVVMNPVEDGDSPRP